MASATLPDTPTGILLGTSQIKQDLSLSLYSSRTATLPSEACAACLYPEVGSSLHFGRKALQCDLNVFQDSLSAAKCMQVVLGDRGIWQDLETDPAVLV